MARCKTGTQTQTVLFPKSWTTARARAWLRRHGKKAGKVDITGNRLRFRQMDPSSCQKGNYATIPLGRAGIQAVICCPKRSGRNGLGALGIEPLTIAAVGVGAVGIPFLLGFFGSKATEAPPSAPGEAPDACGPEQVKAAYVGAATGAVSGAATGASFGPWGAAIGAGVGGGVAFLSNKCGMQKTNEAKKALCKNADKVNTELGKHQAAVPGWDKLSCDQKIGIMAVFGPATLLTGATTAATIAAANIAKGGLCRATDQAISRLKSAGAKIPGGIEGWSCDQKAAFVLALGPAGVLLAFTGVLTGALATNTVKEVERTFKAASDEVAAISKKLGIKVPDISVGGTAGSVLHKVGIGQWSDIIPNPMTRITIE
jgi:hypothetical protein